MNSSSPISIQDGDIPSRSRRNRASRARLLELLPPSAAYSRCILKINYYYMKNYSHSYTSLDNVWKAWQGSLLYVDWDSKDQKNEINHAMVVIGVVVKNGKANPVICQKTPNRNSITLTESLENAHKQKRYNMIW